MLGAEFACKPWRRVALEEPSLWRRVGMENILDEHWRHRGIGVVMAMKLVAVDRAAGQCEAFEGDCDDEYLLNLVERYYDYRSAPLFDLFCFTNHQRDASLFYCKIATLRDGMVFHYFAIVHSPCMDSPSCFPIVHHRVVGVYCPCMDCWCTVCVLFSHLLGLYLSVHDLSRLFVTSAASMKIYLSADYRHPLTS
jgi:hypothetical protein